MMHELNSNHERLLQTLGIEPDFRGEMGPPVDRKKLQRFVRGDLGPFANEEVRSYVCSFRNWHQEFVDLLAEQTER